MNLVALPVLIPLVAACGALFVLRRRVAQRCFSIGAAAIHLIVALVLLRRVARDGIQVLEMGSWPAPYGIVLVADLLGTIMTAVAGLIVFAVAIYAVLDVDDERERLGFHPLLLVLLMGVSGAFLTGDVFNLYVWFEVMLIASFVLLSLRGERDQMEGSIKYVALNLMSSILFLVGVAILYGMAGTLNFADLHVKIQAADSPRLATSVAMLFLVAFGVKAAVFPLFFWLPASYHTPPVAVSAVFAGLLTKVGVYAMVRVFSVIFVGEISVTHQMLTWIAGATMVTGVLGAMAQTDFRRILSFHIVSQIGYMLMGLGLFSPLAVAGTVFYLVHHIIVKTNLFLVSGIVLRGRGTLDLKALGGLYASKPFWALLFVIPALSLAGIPPLSGFFAKLMLVKAGFETGHETIAATAILVSLLTLFSMNKIWNEVFWKEAEHAAPETPAASPRSKPPWAMLVPSLTLAAVTVFLGLHAEPLMRLAVDTAEQILDPSAYVSAVMRHGG